MTLDVPSDGPDPDSWGEILNIRSDDPDGAELKAQFSARLRARVGDEAFARIQRSLELSLSPRPLTNDERAVLRETIAPLLRDLEASRRALPEIREEAHEDYGENAVCAWIQDNGRCGQGIRVWLFSSPAERLRDLAEELQSWAGDVQVDPARRPWPDCPDHPGSHNLSAVTRYEVAVWRCPGSGSVIAEIGSL
jgi:hypothetical protein